MRRTLTALTAAALVVAVPLSAPATIPVIDYTAVAPMISQGLRQAQQYATQIQQLQTAINSYKAQLLQATGLAEAAKIWSSAQQTMQQLQGVYQSYQALTSNSGLQQYLNQ